MLKKSAKYIALTLAFVFVMLSFAGCGKSGQTAQNVLRWNIAGEVKTLDPALNTEVNGASLISAAFEGLMKLDENEAPIPGMAAENPTISADLLTYTFKLRDAKWSDGKPVTAHDFEYAWKRALDPATAAEYAYQMFYIKGGEDFNAGKGKVEDVAVKALDDKTLEVTLVSPTPYFLSLMAFPTYFPVRKDIVEANKEQWAIKPEAYVGNGPFVLKEWRPKDVMVYEKSPNYYNNKEVTLDRLEVKMIEDATSFLAAYKTGQLDFIESPPPAEIPQLVKDGIASIEPYLGTYFYVINVGPNAEKVDPAAGKAMKDPRVRKALNLAIDRVALVENVTKGGQLPATTFVPPGIKNANGNEFKNKDYWKAEGDVAEAKRLLAEAGYPDGKGFPKIPVIYNTTTGNQNIAQALQDMWKTNLGIDIELSNQEFKVFQTTRQDANYIIARHGWIGDYIDPMTFLDMWMKTSGNNDAKYDNAAYDAKINAAKVEQDPDKRYALLHEAEDMIMADTALIPLYYYTNVVCIKPEVKNLRKSVLGFVYFDKVTIEKK
jgi:oligopeptide transport system substrate-binding protein